MSGSAFDFLMSGVTKARLRQEGILPSESDLLRTVVIVGRSTSRISYLAKIQVGMGSREQDVLAESMIILRTYSLSTWSNSLNLESQES